MMPDFFATALPISGIGGLIGAALSLSILRSYFYGAEEERLRKSREFLKLHLEALQKLDDPEIPERVLGSAIDFAKMLRDPRTPSVITYALKKDPHIFDQLPGATDSTVDEQPYTRLVQNRPDLARAYVIASYTGALAFTARWPATAPAFNYILANLAVSPVKTTRKIVEIETKAATYLEAVHLKMAV